jgi:regulator of RNase E activity RraB
MPKTKPPIAANPRTLALRYRAQAIIDREGGNVTCKDIAAELGLKPRIVQASLTARQLLEIRKTMSQGWDWKGGYGNHKVATENPIEVIASMRFDIDQEE